MLADLIIMKMLKDDFVDVYIILYVLSTVVLLNKLTILFQTTHTGSGTKIIKASQFYVNMYNDIKKAGSCQENSQSITILH